MKKSRPTIGIVKSRVFLTGTAFVLMACSSGEEFAGHSGKGENLLLHLSFVLPVLRSKR